MLILIYQIAWRHILEDSHQEAMSSFCILYPCASGGTEAEHEMHPLPTKFGRNSVLSKPTLPNRNKNVTTLYDAPYFHILKIDFE
jgi:hypothetical protein